MLVAGEASVEGECGLCLGRVPSGIAHAVAPGVEVGLLHDGLALVKHFLPAAKMVGEHIIKAFCAVLVGDGRPTPVVVLEDVVCLGVAAFHCHYRKYARRAAKVGKPIGVRDVSRGFSDVLAVAHIAFGARGDTHMFLHGDALPVVAERIVDAVVALIDLVLLVEFRVGECLVRGGKQAF